MYSTNVSALMLVVPNIHRFQHNTKTIGAYFIMIRASEHN